MSHACQLVKRLLEDEPPVAPEQPTNFDDEGDEEFNPRDYVVTPSMSAFSAKGSAFGTRPYAARLEQLGGRRKRKLETRNTYLERSHDGNITIRYYDTDIVTYYPDGSVCVTTGGWPTDSTRKRLDDTALPGGWALFSESYKKHNETAPSVYWDAARRDIKKGIMKLFWYNRHTNMGTSESGWYIPFTDGDIIDPDGTLKHNAEPVPRNKALNRPR
jgi:hypothetical protein